MTNGLKCVICELFAEIYWVFEICIENYLIKQSKVFVFHRSKQDMMN